jgi:hypothetical protein
MSAISPISLSNERKNGLRSYFDIAKSMGLVPISLTYSLPTQLNWKTLNSRNDQVSFESSIKSQYGNNLGVLTGRKSNIIVIIVNKSAQSYWNLFAVSNQANDPFPLTFTCINANGDKYYYFRYDDQISKYNNMDNLMNQNISFRTNNGFVPFAGYVKNDKTDIFVEKGYDVNTNRAVFALAPKWIFKLLDSDLKMRLGM